MNILVTGPEGQVGWELRRTLMPLGQVIGLGRSQLDLTDAQAIRARVREIKPQLIVNAAAYTAVDRAESEPALARAVNATAVAVLAEEARRLNAPIVHYSTDYVFDGRGTRPYRPDDPPNPQSMYGHSKLEGELALRDSGAQYLILRTCWVYGLRGRNFLLAIVRQAALKRELRIVNDQVGSPTPAAMIAEKTAEILQRALKRYDNMMTLTGEQGVYHLACSGSTTWFDFAQAVFRLLPNADPPILVPISTAEYAARAIRPAYSVLDCRQTENTFGVLMEQWQPALQNLLRGDAAAGIGSAERP